MPEADGAALVAAAVRSAILAKAPRRTVAAVAAAVACALVRGPTKAATPRPEADARARAPQDAGPEGAADSASALLAALRVPAVPSGAERGNVAEPARRLLGLRLRVRRCWRRRVAILGEIA